MHIDTNNEKIDISSEKLLEELAAKVFKNIKLGDIIFLIGEMGVGKTTFVKYLVNEFQKQNKLKLTEVTSPTFNLLNDCLLYTSPSPRDRSLSRMPSSA